jgi:hypothetical protein
VTSLTGQLPTASSSGRVRAGQGPGSGLHPGLEPWSKGGLMGRCCAPPPGRSCTSP